MNYKKIIYSLIGISLALSSCEKALDPKKDSFYGDEYTWSLPDQAQGVLLNAYANIPARFDFYSGSNFLDAATDNAVTNNFGSSIFGLGAGTLSATNNPVGDWGNAYTQFRNIHLFMENGLTSKVIYDLTTPANDAKFKARLKGEAFFLRAWWGFQLLQQYGGKAADGTALGYPITLRSAVGNEGSNLNVVRNTYEECALQIMKDCDSALANLPLRYTGSDNIIGAQNVGRADQQAASALKARTAVYAASPSVQPDDIIRITGMGTFQVVNAAAYTAKWERAVGVNQAAMALIGNFTSLKENMFNAAATPADFIWRRWVNNRVMEVSQLPPFDFGSATTGPSQNLVDAFPALNGYPISDPRSNYNASNPYAARDPRLNVNVYYNTRTINGRSLAVHEGGVDSRTRFANATRTGYYVRKWLSAKANILSPESPQNDFHYYVPLRKTELYLNFAEAANEAYGPNAVPPGSTQSASTVIKNIRKGAGLTAASSDAYVNEVAAQGKDAFRSLIQNERRLELAFENHRYFDMRRWVLPLNEGVRGVNVVKTETGAFQYNTVDVEPRNFNQIKHYYFPIPYEELAKSPTLVNNLGW